MMFAQAAGIANTYLRVLPFIAAVISHWHSLKLGLTDKPLNQSWLQISLSIRDIAGTCQLKDVINLAKSIDLDQKTHSAEIVSPLSSVSYLFIC